MKKVTVERPRSFEADTAQKWWIVILQSSVGDDSLKCQIKTEKTGDSYACYSWRGGELWLVEPKM